jgi:3-oxoacyl-[acyl-carrier protein] reductase
LTTSTRRYALVTGGTSGIGLGCAEALAKDFDLALSYASNDERAEQAKEKIQAAHPETRVRVFKKNLVGHESAKELFTEVLAEYGKAPAVLINSAGRLRDGLFLGSDFKVHEEMIFEHLVSSMALCHLAIKDMYREKFGRIINLSSVSARYYKRGQVNYATVKSAIEGFSKCLALEVAHRGVTVNVLAPGLIETSMTAEMIRTLKENKLLRGKIPVGRAGSVDEIGALAAFLCSEKGAYMTGTVLTVDGGRSLGDASL